MHTIYVVLGWGYKYSVTLSALWTLEARRFYISVSRFPSLVYH